MSHISNIPYPKHHPSRTYRIPNIQHPKHTTYQTSHIRGILHPEHPTSPKPHMPNIQHPKHPTFWTSYILNNLYPKHPNRKILALLIFYLISPGNSNFIVSFIKVSTACEFLNIPSATSEFISNKQHYATMSNITNVINVVLLDF